ncbi:MAG: cysteine-rich CWC family protein [Mediterranea sp.]|nr:cysteine-rich CWC family protein [Mediterranea sp.]
MEKICPRCSRFFSCLHNNISECRCASVRLDAQQRAYVETNYSNCLCLSCLEDVRDYFYASGVNPRYRYRNKLFVK